jgi:predicted RNase H-like nuclease (RuvC/YqgF family)
MLMLRAALKSSELVVREYVKKLESENVKLQRQIAKLECNNMSQTNKISALQKKLNAYLKKDHITVIVDRSCSSNKGQK